MPEVEHSLTFFHISNS